jgi:hypothetical protein
MALGGKMHDGVDGVALEESIHTLRIADVTLNEYNALVIHKGVDISTITRIGELVEDYQTALLVVRSQMLDNVAADKSSATSNKYVVKSHHLD